MDLPPNRRASRRLPPRGTVRIKCRKGAMDLGDNLAKALLDLSETGARLGVKKALDNEQEVTLTLESSSSGKRLQRLATVAWCATAADGSISIGIRFDKPLSYADLEHFSRS